MPEHQSAERVQTMRAYGAELVLTPKAGGMETARDIAERMRDEGKGMILDQFANPDNPLAHYRGTGPGDLARHRRAHHAFRVGDGHDRHDHGRVAVPEGEESGDPDRRRAAGRGLADSRASASGRRPTCRRSSMRQRVDRIENVSQADAEDTARRLAREEGIFGGIIVGRRMRGRAARIADESRTRRSCSSSAIAATATCRPACSPRDATSRRASDCAARAAQPLNAVGRDDDAAARLRHRDGARRRGHPPHPRHRRERRRRRRARLVHAAAPRGDRQRFRAAAPAAGRRDRLRAARCGAGSASGRSATRPIPSPS